MTPTLGHTSPHKALPQAGEQHNSETEKTKKGVKR